MVHDVGLEFRNSGDDDDCQLAAIPVQIVLIVL